MKLLKLARLCNPVRLREVAPSPEQLDELSQFKLVNSEESPNLLQCFKDELPGLWALENDINANLFDMESILLFFLSHSAELLLGENSHLCWLPNRETQQVLKECSQC